MRISVGAKTDVGRVRSGNEDSYLVAEPMFAVADGMGGHLAGDIASQTAVRVITEAAEADRPGGPSDLVRFVKEANSAIWQKAHQDPKLQGMGTTCTLLLVSDAQAWLAHVGDSRAYLLRDGELEQLTEDHTLVQRMVLEGRIQPEEAAHHPQRSIITRALGVDEEVEVDITEVELQEGDRILLCSDGLSSMLEEPAIDSILRANPRPQEAADELIAAANDAGGEDNITVVVLDVGSGGGAAAAVAAPPEEVGDERRSLTPAESAPEEADSVYGDEDEEDAAGEPTRGRGRKFFVALIALALIAIAGIGAARYTMSNSWFVSADDRGVVTIYRGIPEEIGGMSLREEVEQGPVSIDQLPEFLRDDVAEGIRAESLEDARQTVANLQARSQDFHREDSP